MPAISIYLGGERARPIKPIRQTRTVARAYGVIADLPLLAVGFFAAALRAG
jgi:hypothetical protein